MELGVEEVVFFCNSPLVRLTDNGLPHMSEGGSKTNIQPENYAEFANYIQLRKLSFAILFDQ